MIDAVRFQSLLARSGVAGALHLPAGTEVADPLVGSICEDSRQVQVGALYGCVPGAAYDGHDFAPEAAERGAVALLSERALAVALPQFVVPQVRAALGPMALALERSPQERLRIAAVTGTNGKTTVAAMLAEILRGAGRQCVTIGTLDGSLTTPPAVELARRLATARDSLATAVILEVSSHGLVQRRVEGLRFAVAAFTNLSPEHLDYHADMEEYYRAKRGLFEQDRADVAVICVDDRWGRRLAGEVAGPLRRCSLDDVEVLRSGAGETLLRWRSHEVRLALGGAHNVANAVVAATMAVELGIDPEQVASGLNRPPHLPGRFEVITCRPATVIVDYAHTPGALERLLSSARALTPNRARLTVVFGCGGERDTAKRPAMGAVASRLADRVIVTSDNPRGEDPATIAEAVMAGADGGALEAEPDRREAIGMALGEAAEGDVIVVAGKGHETRQIIGQESIPFDDRTVIRELLGAGERLRQ